MTTSINLRGAKPRGLSIGDSLYFRALEAAKKEKRSFSFFARRAIERDLANPSALEAEMKAERDDPETATVSTEEVAKMLKLSVSMVRKRQRDPKDPLRRARSRLGKKKPMQFSLAKIRELQRSLG